MLWICSGSQWNVIKLILWADRVPAGPAEEAEIQPEPTAAAEPAPAPAPQTETESDPAGDGEH